MKKILFLIFLFPIYSTSQIVNIENMRLSTKQEGWTGSVDLSLNFTMNTVQLFQLGDRCRIAYRKGKNQVLLLTDHSLVQTKDVSIVNLGFEHIRYNYSFKDSGNVILEFFEQAQFNKIQKINLRLLGGTGIRFHLLDKQNYQLNTGTGFMAEYEDMTDYGISEDILFNSYFSFDGQFTDHIGLNVITYFQPKLIDFGNYRISSETQLRIIINKHLTFRMIYNLTHDSRDILDIRKTNYYFRNSLSFTF